MIYISCYYYDIDDAYIFLFRFVFKNRVAVFSVTVLNEERVLAVAEVREDAADELAFKWMNTVVSAVETIHGIPLYGVLLATYNTLPKIRGSIYIPETKTRYLDSTLSLEHLLMCPHQCVTNLPDFKKYHDRSGPAFQIGELMRGVKNTHLQAAPITPNTEIGDRYKSMGEILEWRGTHCGDLPLYSTTDIKAKVCVLSNRICMKFFRKIN